MSRKWRISASKPIYKCKQLQLAEYSLRGIDTPIGVSYYELTRALPETLKSSLPSIEEIEIELSSDLTG
ncbi:hypothetical protein [Parashewanella hymeniacidonis]|uniref:hypothetical protein n=1 Tax=Parashewanella hymeniacidonis TaxID=2807618 RepID=UPI001EF5CB70|nr:hypothetical protein [Parashewanella hymeniacidonis]